MAFWSKRGERADRKPPRIGGWTAEEFAAVTMHDRIEVLVLAMTRTASWHADFLTYKDPHPGIRWEIEGVVDHHSSDVRIPVSIERTYRTLPEALRGFEVTQTKQLRRQLAGYIALEARYDRIKTDEPAAPFLYVHLRRPVFQEVVKALRLTPPAAGVPRVRVFTVGRENWSYDAFKASIERGEEVYRWMLPLRAAVVWTHWQFR